MWYNLCSAQRDDLAAFLGDKLSMNMITSEIHMAQNWQVNENLYQNASIYTLNHLKF